MEIKFKLKTGKDVLIARDRVQAAAFIKEGFVPANKTEEAKLYGEPVEEEQKVEEQKVEE